MIVTQPVGKMSQNRMSFRSLIAAQTRYTMAAQAYTGAVRSCELMVLYPRAFTMTTRKVEKPYRQMLFERNVSTNSSTSADLHEYALLEAELHGARNVDDWILESALDLAPREVLLAAVFGGVEVADAHQELLARREEPCGVVRVGNEEWGDHAEDDGDDA